MPINEILVLSDLSAGQRVRLARVVLGWRQIDLASNAQVSVDAVSSLELDRPVKRWKLRRILAALDLEATK